MPSDDTWMMVAVSDPRVPYPGALKTFPTLRQSLLSDFDSCSLMAKFDLDQRGGWNFSYQARGSAFHRFAARALREMHALGEERLEVDVALAILHEVLRQADADRECPHCGSDRIRKGIVNGMRTCLACKQRFETEVMNLPMHEIADLVWVVKKFCVDNTWDISHLVSTEERLETKISYPNPHGGWVERVLTGQLDSVFLDPDDEGHAIVLDWKDMWAVPAPTEVSFEGYFQQRFYALLLMRNYRSIERATLREFYVRYSEPREATVWRSLLEDIEVEMAGLAERFDRTFEEKLWTPSPGKQCSFCPTPHKCPIIPEARGPGRIASDEEARRVAGQLVVGAEIVKKNRQALQTWASRHGPIPVRDAKGRRVYGYREAERTYAPKLEEIEAAEQMKGEPLSANELKRLWRTSKGTRFEAYTPLLHAAEEEDEKLLSQLRASVANSS